MKIRRLSPISQKIHEMDLDITDDQIVAYNSGVLLQNAFPKLTPDEREFFKTGITPDEWNGMFAALED